jgi:hypothetical protein
MLVIQVDMLCVLLLRLLMRDLLVKCGDTCHTVRFLNVLHNYPALLFFLRDFQLFVILYHFTRTLESLNPGPLSPNELGEEPYIFNTNLNPLRSAHSTKAVLSFSSPS